MLDLIQSDQYSAIGYIGGKGSGKTGAGARCSVVQTVSNPGLDGMIIAPTYNLLHSVSLIEFEKAAGDLIAEKNENKRFYRMRNRARVWFSSGDHAYTLEGKNLAWAWIDEAQDISHEAFKNIMARLRVRAAKHKCCFVTATPMAGTWLQKEFDGGKKRRTMLRVNSRENIFNSEDYIDTLLGSLSAHEARAFIDGEWLQADPSGRVYPEFDPHHHLIEFVPDWRKPVWIGVDYGFRWPYWCAVQQRDSGGLVVIHEDPINNVSTETLGNRIADWLQRGHYDCGHIACDPTGGSTGNSASERNTTNVQALRETLRDRGFNIPIVYYTGAGSARLRSVNAGVERVRGALMNARNETHLWIARELADTPSDRGIVKAMQNYRWRRDRQSPLYGEQVQQADHACDAVRYLVLWHGRSGGGVIKAA